MNIRFDFIVHWLYAILWALLAMSGFAMVGAKYGWILSFNFALADDVHRIAAALFVVLTFISMLYEVWRSIKRDEKYLAWHIIGRSGYQLFTFLVTLILIITGAIIWICHEMDMTAVGFALFVHEYISYLALASVIWHIYQKSHALLWPKKKG
jgi:cytochrome b subunit of formate dehydrogenase